MKIEKKDLEQELREMLIKAKAGVSVYRNLTLESLNGKPSEEGWSILECIEHLCRYGRFYVPEIQSRISQSGHHPDRVFKSGILGNYFAESMRSKPKLNKMNTFKSMNPQGSNIPKEVLK